MAVPHGQENDPYIDFLVVGKTGMGKSTTADRLLVANSKPGTKDVSPQEREGGNTLLDDILIWRLNNRSVDDVKARVKYFLTNRAAGEEAIDPHNKGPDSKTMDCVLLSNEKTRIRVLDVPGFHTSAAPQHSEQAANMDNLGIMRQILRIQAEKKLHFHRILYFLPNRGPCERADKNFQEELEVMNRFFGHVIFNSMVVIATESPRRSRPGAFTKEDIKDCRTVLNRAFQLAFAAPGQNPDDIRDIPQPPIFYLSLEESSSKIIERLQGTVVKHPHGIELHLHENICSRCSLKFGVYSTDKVTERLVSIGADNGGRSSYNLSQCHSLITPKYSKVQKILGGVAHVLLLGIPKLAGATWPGFFNHDEECADCKAPPGSPGCLKVGSVLEIAGEKVTVDHKSELDGVVVQR